MFGFAELTKNAGPDKYKYSGYGKGFGSRSEFSYTDENIGEKLELIWAHLCILIIKIKTSKFLVKDQHKDYMIIH